MQPPPRKGNPVKFLKHLHTEQIAKLQVKNQTECELLDDLRSFMIKKCALEKSYSEQLLKITSVYLNKKIATNVPDLKTEGSEERWNMWSVWRTVLEENEKLSKAKLAAIEIFHQQIADDVKILRLQKLQNTKKCIDQLGIIQKELQMTVQDVERAKKNYFDEEHCAHDVRDKAKDIEAKLKRKKGSFFQSFSTLQKSSAKVSQKRELMDDKSAGARNDYLLSLAAANAHQTKYFVNDLQTIMQVMEGNVYEKVQKYFALIGRAELITCSAQQASYTKVRDQALQLTREYNMQCLYLYYPVLKQHIQYEFEPCDGDTTDVITVGYGNTTADFITEEVREWFYKVIRAKRTVEDSMIKLHAYNSLREQGHKVDPNDPNGPDLETKMEDNYEAIRKAEVTKVKTEAKIELFKAGDETIREMIEQLEKESIGSDFQQQLMKEDSKMSESNVSSNTDSNQEYDTSDEEVDQITSNQMPKEESVPQQFEEHEPKDIIRQMEASWGDDGTDSEIPASSSTIRTANVIPRISQPPSYANESEVIFKCRALYNYDAQNPDELNLTENDELDILGEGDGEGWLKARNERGQEGFVPCSFLDTTGTTGLLQDGTEEDTPHLTSQISFSSVDYTVDQNLGTTSAIAIEEDWSSEKSVSIVTVQELAKPNELDITNGYDIQPEYVIDNSTGYCRAMYDYETTEPDELSFYEGEVIKIVRKITHDNVDDGWWEGEINDRIGLFPSLIVQECLPDGEILTPEEDDKFNNTEPPPFTPPEVPDVYLVSEDDYEESEPPKFLPPGPPDFSPPSPPVISTPESPKKIQIVQPQVVPVPDVQIIEINEDEDEQLSVIEDEKESEEPNCLGITKIVITAATPSSDSGDKSFPPPPPPEPAPADPQAIALERRKSAGEINEAEPPLYDATLVGVDYEEYPPTIFEEPEDFVDDNDDSSAAAAFSRSGSEDDTTSGPPSSAGNSPNSVILIANTIPTATTTSENSVIPTSIPISSFPNGVPEQLEPHQLERLQDLKESSA